MSAPQIRRVFQSPPSLDVGCWRSRASSPTSITRLMLCPLLQNLSRRGVIQPHYALIHGGSLKEEVSYGEGAIRSGSLFQSWICRY